jgi:protein arginine N-methyltransferase 7
MEIDRLISAFMAGIEGKPNYARNLVGLAEVVFGKKEEVRAFELARRALRESEDDTEADIRARALLSSILPSYHIRMMNDARRNHAWDQALRRAVRPGMHVLEIGTGAGMLALMAARAGAAEVTTCESDPVAAAIASEISERNGYGSVIKVIPKRSQDLAVGVDIERPADLLFCDIFADDMLGFDPLPALADARSRLVTTGAPVVPAAGVIKVALANWEGCAITCRAKHAAGFDISSFGDLVRPSVTVPIGATDLTLFSRDVDAFRFDFGSLSHPRTGRIELSLEADRDGIVDGIIQWICLELDSETVLEARPKPGLRSFSSPLFWPLPESVEVRCGDVVNIAAEYVRDILSIRRSAGK